MAYLVWLFVIFLVPAYVSFLSPRLNNCVQNVSKSDSKHSSGIHGVGCVQPQTKISSAVPEAQIDVISPSAVPVKSPVTEVRLTGTSLDRNTGIYLLDQNSDWIQLPFLHPRTSTRATVVISSSYFSRPGIILLSSAPDFRFAQSMMVYSQDVAQTVVDPTWKVTVTPEDIGAGGPIEVRGSGFESGMKVILGRGHITGIILPTKLLSDSDLQADIPEYIPGDDFFLAVLSADGKRLSAPFGVMSTYPQREDDFSQQSFGPSAANLSIEGSRLMKNKNYKVAAVKFVEATRVPLCRASIWYAPKECAMFANNAGFAYYRLGQYEESITWIRKAIAIDPKRAIAYLNRGDAFVALHNASLHHHDKKSYLDGYCIVNDEPCVAEARKDYEKYLELVPNSDKALEVKKKLEALPRTP